MKKVFFFAIMGLIVLTMQAQSYVDLGLPSGTKWKDKNEAYSENNKLFSYSAASSFCNNLPSKAQWEELKVECQWEWMENGYKVIGPNGNSIFLPADGFRLRGGYLKCVGSYGYYWSTKSYGDNEAAWGLYFRLGSVDMDYFNRSNGLSVRLVQD